MKGALGLILGSETDVVILSTVRSNSRGSLGFLPNPQRINVALTRARRLLVLVCDVSTLEQDPLLKSLIEHMKKNGACISSDCFFFN